MIQKNDYKGLHFFEALESSAKKLGNRITLSELENELIQQTFEITLLVEIQQIEILEKGVKYHSRVFIVNFELISHLFLPRLLLTLSKYLLGMI